MDTDGHLGTSPVSQWQEGENTQPQASFEEFKKQQETIAELEATVACLVQQ